ncbi:MAG TPA: erythromycin esterase family protein [Tepidisphaeraceae bacterium]|nr:erythromycin esterase family protein [Tepidisphaeraceae bacterium]
MIDSTQAIKSVEDASRLLHGRDDDFEPLLDAVGNARLVLIGEASHGTHEFYQTRARITQRLIEDKGFSAVIAEADWPDAYRVNRYVRGTNDDPTAERALSGFERFPQWMWRNQDVLDFVEWLRRHNQTAARGRPRCGFYGMDLYSLYTSMAEVLDYLDRVDPQAARRARFRYGCFEQFEEDPQAYGYAAAFDLGGSCQEKVVAQLVDMQRHTAELARRDGQVAEDEAFYAEQNARLAQNAEAYYRQMFAGRIDTWNLRDTHMADTIDALLRHLDRTRGEPARAVVWAHNSHLGDARATQMSVGGEVNVGQLCRQRWGRAVFNIGFTTHTGLVAAATDWGGKVEMKQMLPSLPGSYERLLHDVGFENFMLIFGQSPEAAAALAPERLERAIGVIYRPETERASHYFRASLPRQFDAVIHVDVTSAVWPLEAEAPFEPQKAETYPSGV